MTGLTVAATTRPVMLTDAAVAKTVELLAHEEPGLALCVAVQPGGCAGLRYRLYFSDAYKHVIARELAEFIDEGYCEPENEAAKTERTLLGKRRDSLTWIGRIPVLVEAKSLPYLQGTTLDYDDTYTIDNPNAAGSCACGDPFD